MTQKKVGKHWCRRKLQNSFNLENKTFIMSYEAYSFLFFFHPFIFNGINTEIKAMPKQHLRYAKSSIFFYILRHNSLLYDTSDSKQQTSKIIQRNNNR